MASSFRFPKSLSVSPQERATGSQSERSLEALLDERPKDPETALELVCRWLTVAIESDAQQSLYGNPTTDPSEAVELLARINEALPRSANALKANQEEQRKPFGDIDVAPKLVISSLLLRGLVAGSYLAFRTAAPLENKEVPALDDMFADIYKELLSRPSSANTVVEPDVASFGLPESSGLDDHFKRFGLAVSVAVADFLNGTGRFIVCNPAEDKPLVWRVLPPDEAAHTEWPY